MNKEERFFLNALKMKDMTEKIVNRFVQKNPTAQMHSSLRPKNNRPCPTISFCGGKSKATSSYYAILPGN
jgi:hypothetical protein